MATFNVEGFEEAEMMILRQEDAIQRVAPDMLKAGAEVLMRAQQAALRRISNGDRSIGTLANSISIGSVKTSATSIYIDVYPQGEQSHGSKFKSKRGRVSNAHVGFLLEYGSTKTPARPWLSSATEAAAPAVQEAMRKVWEEKQNG